MNVPDGMVYRVFFVNPGRVHSFFSAIFICNSFRGFAFTLILPDVLILRYLKIKIIWP